MGFSLQNLRIIKAYFYGSEHEFTGLFHEVILPFALKYMGKDYAILKKRQPVPHYQILYEYDEKMEAVSRAYLLEEAIESFCKDRTIHYSEDELKSNVYVMQMKDEPRQKTQVDAQIRYDIYIQRHKKVVCNYVKDVYQRAFDIDEDIVTYVEILFAAQDKMNHYMTAENKLGQSEVAFWYHLLADVSHGLHHSFEDMMDLIGDKMMTIFKDYEASTAENYMKRFERWYRQFIWVMTIGEYRGNLALSDQVKSRAWASEREHNILVRCIESWMETLGIYGVRVSYCCYAALRYTNEWNEIKDRTVLI